MNLTFASAFSGAGGFDLGFHQEGFKCLWTSEIARDPSDVLAKLGAPNHGDIKGIDPWQLDVPCVFIWGSPCQDLSRANRNQRGIHGQKSSLFYDGIRLSDALSKRGTQFVIWENVAGALNSNESEDFRAVLHAFLELRPTSLAWRVLDAKYFGVPQSRRRIIIVADFGGESAGQILCDADSSRLLPATWHQNGMDVPAASSVGTCTARSPARSARPDTLVHATLRTQRPANDGQPGYIISPCLQTKAPSRAFVGSPSVMPSPGPLRWRTPLESDRLMGWPDNWTAVGASGKRMSDAARYAMTGNGVVAPVARWLAVGVRRVLEHQAKESA